MFVAKQKAYAGESTTKIRQNPLHAKFPKYLSKTGLSNVPSGPDKTCIFRFSWWNGGGRIRMRMQTNPELRKLLQTNPDIFAYGEAETPSSQNL